VDASRTLLPDPGECECDKFPLVQEPSDAYYYTRRVADIASRCRRTVGSQMQREVVSGGTGRFRFVSSYLLSYLLELCL